MNYVSTMSNNDYQIVEKAIAYLEANFQNQPDLETLAAHVNLSPFHLQRVFKRWAGVSPKRFLQALTLDYAQKLLAGSGDILETSYQAGLSGPGRLHDLFVSVDAVTPGEFKAQGAGLEISYGFHPTPFGDCLLGLTERGIVHLAFVDGDRDKALAGLQKAWPKATLHEDSQATQTVLAQIFLEREAPAGRALTLYLKGTNFQLKVWEALLQIPAGAVCAYSDIARYIGKPKAPRAVGNAVAVNPVAYLIPCHRVLRKQGQVGQYRWGARRKKAILGWESMQTAVSGEGG